MKIVTKDGIYGAFGIHPLHAHDWDDEASVSSINGLPKLSWIAGGNICIHVQVLYVLYTVVILCHFDHC